MKSRHLLRNHKLQTADTTTRPSPDAAAPLISSAPLQGERVAFTGTLASMTHREAAGYVEQQGGVFTAQVSQQTTLLVVGDEGWPLEEDGQPSVKLEAMRDLLERGFSARILSEAEWLRLIGLEQSPHGDRRVFTPAMLSQLMKIPVSRIRHWERLGLIRPVRRVCRLPYFDFQEVTGVRRLADLIASGIPPKKIGASLQKLRTLLPTIDRPLAQLEILAQDRQLFVRDSASLFDPQTGQRVFDFAEPAPAAAGGSGPATDDHHDHETGEDQATIPFPTADQRLHAATAQTEHWGSHEWVNKGSSLLDSGETVAAIQAFRRALLFSPQDASIQFHLADALYRQGNSAGAVERYYAAVECDAEYIEAWTQLGCVLAQMGETDAAGEAFEAALHLHPDYPDAHLHLAELFEQIGQPIKARPHWLRYLDFDHRGPWAELARECLERSTGGLANRDTPLA
ncbi:MAG: GlcNAc transferase [Planctomyces sp.]|nr:GlcNAc transferase [Planctomyces sp.]